MNVFLIASAILIVIISAGCAEQQAVKLADLAKINKASETKNPVIEECVRLATSSRDIFPGWDLALPVRTYDEKSIFDYIDGAAELYFAYGFRAVATAEYRNGETSVIVDVYDMTIPDNAFGIYSLNRYQDANYVDVGNEGIMSGASLDFWKGNFFCKVYSYDISERYQKDVVNFGKKLALQIKEAGQEPAVIDRLPQKDLLPRSARFFSRKLGLDNIHYVSEEDVLNLGMEARGVVADYQIDNIPFQLFIIEYPFPEAANAAFVSYSEYLQGEVVSTGQEDSKKYRIVKVDDRFILTAVKDMILCGAWDIETKETAELVLQMME